MNNLTAIFCADLHVRDDQPENRIDDYFLAQQKKLDFLFKTSAQYHIPIFIAGDFGNKPIWSNYLLAWYIKRYKYNCPTYIIPGQHDLPFHSLGKINESGVNVLKNAGTLFILEPKIFKANKYDIFPCFFGDEMQKINKRTDKRQVAIIHKMIVEKEDIWTGQGGIKAIDLLKQFSEYDLVVTGDNHLPFAVEYKGRKLINPGSMMRMATSQKDHHPRFYLWEAETNEIGIVYFPIEENVFDLSHVRQKEIDEKMQAYAESLKQDYEIGLSFEKNLNSHFEKNKTKKEVKEKIWKARR